MKKILLIYFFLINVSSFSIAETCEHKKSLALKTIFIHPIYKADVNYLFSKNELNGVVQIKWGIDKQLTNYCFNSMKNVYPEFKVLIPPVKFNKLYVNAFGGLTPGVLNTFQESNGQWFGQTDFIKVPLELREQVEKAIIEKQKLVEISGDFYFSFIEMQKKEFFKIDCTQKGEVYGILPLIQRMKEIKEIIESSDNYNHINLEESMQLFLGNCVAFEKIDLNSFNDFNRYKTLSKINKGDFSIIGNFSKEFKESLIPISLENASLLDLED